MHIKMKINLIPPWLKKTKKTVVRLKFLMITEPEPFFTTFNYFPPKHYKSFDMFNINDKFYR